MQTFLLLLHLSAQLSRQPNRFKQKQKQTNFSKFLTTQSDTATRSSTWSRASSSGSEEARTARPNRTRFSGTARRRYLHLRRWASPRSPSHRPRRRRRSLSRRVDGRTILWGRCLGPTRWRCERVGAWGRGGAGRRRGYGPLKITGRELRRRIRRLRRRCLRWRRALWTEKLRVGVYESVLGFWEGLRRVCGETLGDANVHKGYDWRVKGRQNQNFFFQTNFKTLSYGFIILFLFFFRKIWVQFNVHNP